MLLLFPKTSKAALDVQVNIILSVNAAKVPCSNSYQIALLMKGMRSLFSVGFQTAIKMVTKNKKMLF